MSGTRKTAGAALVEAAAYAVAIYYSLPPDMRRDFNIKFWYYLARSCRTAAATLGAVAIVAETTYWKEVQP